ncbi:hypothetical protein BJ322DRAFT_1123986 [Thelephora terrestris]|uniref:CCZ1/INTU/HSP4 first Longin domain-containing protein n=1 Tax=Thelephora terrestris TaxID=56493 RepID=A0A9P6HED4_9AGAM|nr:hypothetical protein BJ322DRAFT_1123986 [Thelephora terrestris]
MSRIPASLLYLTVYNPTLKPTGPVADDDEDAEEQAQILFYTARDRAVSRDRMLRQIGLAKALVNFTEMFNPGGEPCENVHSQTRRMVMMSPEPGFWIHACVELPKTTRQPVKSPSKGKKSEPVKQEPLFEYHEGLVHDIALKTHLQRAYELFKIRHGSFTSILDTLGQQALELQLERFFTVWAWSWDMEEQPDFCSHLGRPLHPYYKVLASQFEPLDDILPEGVIHFALSPSGLIPSPRFSRSSPSPALVQHLRSILPEYIPSVPHSTPDPESEIKPTSSNDNATGQRSTGGFALPTIPMPAVHLNMDVRNLKWGWPGYLTFGKNSKDKEKQKNAKVVEDERKPDSELETKPDAGGERGTPLDAPVVGDDVPGSDPQKEEEKVEVEAEVDTVSLVDAMGSEISHGGSSNGHSPGSGTPGETPPSPATRTIAPPSEDDATPTAIQPVNPALDAQEGSNEASEEPTPTRPPSPNPVEMPPAILEPTLPRVNFSQTLVHLAPLGHPLRTIKRRLYYLMKEDVTVAIVDDESLSLQNQEDTQPIAEVALKVAEKLRNAIYDEERLGNSGTPVTAAKILQPKDTHIFSVEGDYAVTGLGGFKSTSEHLYGGQQLLEGDQDIVEVFSRDSNPQHWHIARKGNVLEPDGRATQSAIYYRSARKESSLSDVDNEVAAAMRKFTKPPIKSVSRANTIIAPQPKSHT